MPRMRQVSRQARPIRSVRAYKVSPRRCPTSGELFLIDGNSLAYRAFFALPESIATADGRPTNAIYGFASMMAKILIDHRPAGVIVAWDAGMSGREQVYEPYKAQRRPRPDLLGSSGRTSRRSPRRSASATSRSRAGRPTT